LLKCVEVEPLCVRQHRLRHVHRERGEETQVQPETIAVALSEGEGEPRIELRAGEHGVAQAK
jgi:hypothetical protein